MYGANRRTAIGKLLTATIAGNSFLLMATAHARSADQQPEPVFAVSTTTVLQADRFTRPLNDTTAASPSVPDSAALYKTTKAPQVALNAAVVKFVADYLKKNTEVLQKVEARSEPVFKIMEPILAKYEIPLELKYLAVVESDLKRTAVSRVGAAGPWQLMPGTARELGLKVSKKSDERKQYYKSTTAAAKYLRDLYNYYGDWLLVIAAYNAGPGTINKAIKRAGSHNFWKLQYFLPAETRGHVKRFISTHYYFEDGGSATTLTKAENLAYEKARANFRALQQSETEVLASASAETIPAKETEAETVLISKQK